MAEEGTYKLFGDLRVEIRDSVATDEVEIIFYRSTPDYIEIYEMSDFGWKIHRHSKGEALKINEMNFLRMDRHMAQALRDGLVKMFGPRKQDSTESELEAVKKHLGDTRDMLMLFSEKVLPHALRRVDQEPYQLPIEPQQIYGVSYGA